ncbi:MAG: TolC family protein [Gemmatimonadetes bacterium]|nr:TolC family protein [Gemmatimonadota bacterium]NNK63673.1 TolC family protein [Gemmatimonadota bacterium]
MIRTTRFGLVALAATALLPLTLSAQDPVLGEVEPYTVGSALPPTTPGSTLIEMTLEDAIARALDVNLDLQSARLNPEIQAYALQGAHAAFSPTLSTSFGFNNSTSLSTSQLDGGSSITNERATLNTSLSKLMPWSGGRLSANFNNARTETNNSFATRNPSYSSSINLSFTQPLLAGFSIDNQRAALETQEIQTEITDLQLESQIENITGQVQSGYWTLRATIEQIEIQRLSLAQAEQLLAENRVRADLGRATEFQVIQSEAQVASAQQALLNAEIQWRNRELALKQLLLDGAGDPLLTATINPVDLPELEIPNVDLDGAVENALGARTDLRQQREQLEISDINLDVSRSNRLPTLDLTASYALQGVGGDLFQRGDLGGDPLLVSSGGFGDGLQAIADRDAPTWNVSLNASYPIGTNAQATALERARLQYRQQELALRSQELGVVTQVTAAGLAVQNTFLQYEAAQRSRAASEQNVAAELARFEVGVATNFELVTAQNQLTTARLSELQALINHLTAVADFERVQRVGGGF